MLHRENNKLHKSAQIFTLPPKDPLKSIIKYFVFELF